MALSAGYLNKRISFFSPFLDSNNEDEFPSTATHKAWANVKYQNGRQILKNGDMMMANTLVITLRVHSWLSDRDRIAYQDRMYRITSMNLDPTEDTCTIVAEMVEG